MLNSKLGMMCFADVEFTMSASRVIRTDEIINYELRIKNFSEVLYE